MSQTKRPSFAERLQALQASYKASYKASGPVLFTPRGSHFSSSQPRCTPAPATAASRLEPKPALARGLGGLGRAPGRQPDLFKAAPKKVPAPKKNPAQPKVVKTAAQVREKTLKTLGLGCVAQALLCVPSAYSDCRSPLGALAGVQDGQRALFWLRRTGVVEVLDRQKRPVSCAPYASIFEAPYRGYWSEIAQLQVQLADEDGALVWVSVFNAWRLKDSDPRGFMLIEGELRSFHSALHGARRFLTGTSEPPPEMAGKIWVRYAGAGGPSEAAVLDLVRQAQQDEHSADVCAHELVSTSLLAEAQLLAVASQAGAKQYASLREFLTALHAPSTPQEGVLAAAAARAIAVAGICNAARVHNFRPPCAQAPINLTAASVQQLIASQPETLTGDQRKAIEAMAIALRSPNPLNGLISGDVGTGKTLVFLVPAVAAHLAGARVAIVSPTEILANQVAANLSRRFPSIPVERVLAGSKIKDPQAILVGTSGLGSVARKAGYVPNLLVIDEQHKLSTKDRNAMVGPFTHQMEASATPIPRSLASTLFSGMQVFTLSQAPVVRSIESFVLDETSRAQAVAWMRSALDEGSRVALIYPRVDKGVAPAQPASEGGATAVSSVNAAAEALDKRFPGRVGKLHGKMSTEEVSQALALFRSGQQPLVVATTIMETGIDVPDIRLLIVKDADNFGAAQLHQLRGRLARNGGKARFVMMVNDVQALAPETAQRLGVVRAITDGYALAEADMASRGFGDLAGYTQSGAISAAFRLLKLTLDDFGGQSRSG